MGVNHTDIRYTLAMDRSVLEEIAPDEARAVRGRGMRVRLFTKSRNAVFVPDEPSRAESGRCPDGSVVVPVLRVAKFRHQPGASARPCDKKHALPVGFRLCSLAQPQVSQGIMRRPIMTRNSSSWLLFSPSRLSSPYSLHCGFLLINDQIREGKTASWQVTKIDAGVRSAAGAVIQVWGATKP